MKITVVDKLDPKDDPLTLEMREAFRKQLQADKDRFDLPDLVKEEGQYYKVWSDGRKEPVPDLATILEDARKGKNDAA